MRAPDPTGAFFAAICLWQRNCRRDARANADKLAQLKQCTRQPAVIKLKAGDVHFQVPTVAALRAALDGYVGDVRWPDPLELHGSDAVHRGVAAIQRQHRVR